MSSFCLRLAARLSCAGGRVGRCVMEPAAQSDLAELPAWAEAWGWAEAGADSEAERVEYSEESECLVL